MYVNMPGNSFPLFAILPKSVQNASGGLWERTATTLKPFQHVICHTFVGRICIPIFIIIIIICYWIAMGLLPCYFE